MFKSAVLFAVGGLAVVALAPSYLPIPAHAPADKPHAPSVGEAAPASDAAPRTVGFREAVLEADSRGQYAADALVNGAPVRMMVDTGASVVVLSAGTGARLGLVASPGPKWTIKTANGVTTASPVVLDHVSFGGLYMNDVQAVVLAPEAGDVNLLGASFLKRLIAVEQRGGVLVLRQ
jgi:aspartyl protease family protein